MTTKKKAQLKSKAAKTSRTTRKPSRVIILFGIEQDGTARAARFADDDQQHLATVAFAQGLRLAIGTKAAHFEAIRDLPITKAGKPGKTNIPKVSPEVMQKVVSLVGGQLEPISATLPQSPDDLAAGHVVLAQEALDDGYFPAVVREREANKLLLCWRDAPDLPSFERAVDQVGLIHPINS